MNVEPTPDHDKPAVRAAFVGLGSERITGRRHVYVIWSGNEIVYIGSSQFPDRRFDEHRRHSGWWRPDMQLEVVATFTRNDAAANGYERYLIQLLEPVHNIKDKPTAITELEDVFGITIERGAA